MAVDPFKPRMVLVVHGVEIGTDAGLHQDDEVRTLIEARLGGIPLNYEVELYRYENLNDKALKKFKDVLGLILDAPIGGVLADKALDLVADVVIARSDTSTAEMIRQGLRERVEAVFQAEQPCYIVAHSLGSIYAFDVINELMKEDEYFDRATRKSWPVQGLVSMGSPIGLPMFRKGARRWVSNLGDGVKWFRWLNYWDRTDPVVSGDIFGQQLAGFQIAERYLDGEPEQGWVIRDRPTDTGKVWLMAHTAYWHDALVGDGIVDLITN